MICMETDKLARCGVSIPCTFRTCLDESYSTLVVVDVQRFTLQNHFTGAFLSIQLNFAEVKPVLNEIFRLLDDFVYLWPAALYL